MTKSPSNSLSKTEVVTSRFMIRHLRKFSITAN